MVLTLLYWLKAIRTVIDILRYTTIQRFTVVTFFFLTEINTFISRDALIWSNSDSEDIYNVKKDLYLKLIVVLNFLFIKKF